MFNRLLVVLALFALCTSAQQSNTTLQGGSSINSGAALNVNPNAPITVVVTPPTASVSVGNTQNFTATLTNDVTNAGVNWSIQNNTCSGGTVNRLLWSQAFDTPGGVYPNPPIITNGWVVFQTGITAPIITPNTTVAPDGTNTAETLTFPNIDLTTADSEIDQIVAPTGSNLAGQTFTFSVYMKADSNFGVEMDIVDVDNFDGNFTFANLTTSWQRFSVTFTFPTPFTIDHPTLLLVNIGNKTIAPATPNGAHIFLWGAQLESGSTASTYVRNDGAVSTVGCGSISPTFSRSGQTVTFSAPAVLPTNPTITLTATSIADPSKFASSTITITQQPPSNPTIINFTPGTPKQPGANVLVFPAPNLVGDTPVVVSTMKDGANVTSIVDQLGRSFTSVGCQEDIATVGHTVMYYMINNSQTITSVTVNSTGTAGGNVDVGYLDMNTGSSVQPDVAAVCTGTAVATTNPLGPAVTTATAGDVVVSAITVSTTATGIQPPFTFGSLTRGDGMAYAIVGPPATITPNWTQISGGWAGVTAAFKVGAQPGNISVSLNPTCVVVQTGQSHIFTNTVTNDTTHAGSNLSLAGPSCSSSTCGTTSPANPVQSGTNVTYTAPATVPTNPGVVLTDTSVADGTKAATACITITSSPSITVSVNPTTINVSAGGTAQTVAATLVNDTGNLGVTWALSGPTCTGSNCGTLSGVTTTSANYIPPPTVSTNTSVTLTASSVGDPTKKATTAITVTPTITPPSNCQPNCPAFPGAQGGGAAGVGGRGGVAIEVTNLSDSGTGSLRACVQASGPRNCVFRVAGLIPVTSGDLRVDNPFLSVDGQTAPGQIILGGPSTNGSVFRISTHDVTIQYITVSPDNKNVLSGPSTGTIGLAPTNCNCFNIVIDHVSTRWAGNKMLINVSNFVGPNKNITFQNSMLYEPHEGHPVGPGTSGNPVGCPGAAPDPNLANPCFNTLEVQVDYHHSLFANIDHRIPEDDNKSNQWISNIVFNWSFYANEWLGASTIDVINNKFVPGNLNAGAPGPGGCSTFGCAGPAQTFPIHFSDDNNGSNELPPGTPSVFVSGNICRGDSTAAADQYGRCTNEISGENGNEIGPIPSSWKRTTPDPRTFPITQDAASTLDGLILPLVGNSQHLNCDGSFATHRDGADSRIITQYKNGTIGGFWPNGVSYLGQTTIPTPTGTYTDQPVTAGFTLCTETLHDGIPDAWKTKFGLSLSDTGLSARIDTKNGFTFYENYKYALVP